MNDFKSKLPDFKELTEMTAKLFNGIRNSVDEIIQDYKQKRADIETAQSETRPTEATPKKPVVTASENPEPIVPPVDSPESPPVEKPVAPPENPTV